MDHGLGPARRALAAVFLVNGTVLASWVPHIPAARDRHTLGYGALGLVLLAMAAGAILALPAAGWLVERLGSRAVTRAAELTLLAEGAMADWSAVYLRSTLRTSPAVAATGFAAFSLAMAAGRFGGDGLVPRIGPRRLLRASGALGAAGLGAALLVGHPADRGSPASPSWGSAWPTWCPSSSARRPEPPAPRRGPRWPRSPPVATPGSWPAPR